MSNSEATSMAAPTARTTSDACISTILARLRAAPARLCTATDVELTSNRCPMVSSGATAEHSYGVQAVNHVGVSGPAGCGVGFGGGSASVVVDVCVATLMRGLVPHDRVCEMRSGAVLSRRAGRVWLLRVFSRVAPRVVAPVRSPRRAVWWWRATPSLRVPSSGRRVRGRRRRR